MVHYDQEIEDKISQIEEILRMKYGEMENMRWHAIKLLEQDSLAEGLLASVDTEDGRIAALTRQCRESWATRHGEDMVRSIAHARFAQRGTSRHAARNAWSSSPR